MKTLKLLLALALLAFLFNITPVFAITYVVDTTTDGEDTNLADPACYSVAASGCSLRAAVQQANFSAGDDIIQIPAGFYALTLSGAAEDSAALGDLDITSNIDLIGVAPSKKRGKFEHTVIVDASAIGERAFHILGTGVTVSMTDFQIQNGSDVDGGGVNNRGNLSLNGMTLFQNTASNQGGALYSTSYGTSTVTNLFETEVLSNVATNEGGGIYIGGGNHATTVDSSLIQNNQVDQIGGGIYADTDELVIVNSVVSINTVLATGLDGGEGGGVYVYRPDFVSITSSEVRSNAVIADTNAQGGGVSVYLGEVVVIDESLINENILEGTLRSTAGGFGCFTCVSVSLTNSHFDDNSVTSLDDTAGYGGISVTLDDAGSFLLENSFVLRNRLTSYGRGTSYPGTSAAGAYVSTAFSNGASLTIANTSFFQNTIETASEWAEGAALWISGGSSTTISQSQFSRNSIEGISKAYTQNLKGGGVYFGFSDTLRLSESTFHRNSISSLISSNYEIGGGAYFGVSSNDLLISQSTFSDNSVGFQGGGLAFEYFDNVAEIENSTFSGNSSGGNGAGIAVRNYAGIYTASVRLANVTIYDNVSNGEGGGVYFDSGNHDIKNTILAGNRSALLGNDCRMGFSATLTSDGFNLIGDIRDCGGFLPSVGEILGDSMGTGRINPRLDPLNDNGGFTRTHALKPASLAIDAGRPIGCRDWDANLLTTDQRGNVRSTPCDIGAYEAP